MNRKISVRVRSQKNEYSVIADHKVQSDKVLESYGLHKTSISELADMFIGLRSPFVKSVPCIFRNELRVKGKKSNNIFSSWRCFAVL